MRPNDETVGLSTDDETVPEGCQSLGESYIHLITRYHPTRTIHGPVIGAMTREPSTFATGSAAKAMTRRRLPLRSRVKAVATSPGAWEAACVAPSPLAPSDAVRILLESSLHAHHRHQSPAADWYAESQRRRSAALALRAWPCRTSDGRETRGVART